jgi:hypothetical protein
MRAARTTALSALRARHHSRNLRSLRVTALARTLARRTRKLMATPQRAPETESAPLVFARAKGWRSEPELCSACCMHTWASSPASRQYLRRRDGTGLCPLRGAPVSTQAGSRACHCASTARAALMLCRSRRMLPLSRWARSRRRNHWAFPLARSRRLRPISRAKMALRACRPSATGLSGSSRSAFTPSAKPVSSQPCRGRKRERASSERSRGT